ncbi:FAD:protein FMN transferase [Ideonella sp. DXS29W]|uniref:FAD:protein FMN transferase n=1 Tax=Ideonella lacteola TaxID=2984193 RepID=A0ABU9BTF7_9BURK
MRGLAHFDRDGWHWRFGAMASHCEIVVGHPEAEARAAVDAAVAEVRRIEAKYSRYQADSIVSRINAAAGTGVATAIDPETAGLLAFADQLHRQSGGLFDLTSGVLRRAWDFRAARVPGEEELAAIRPLIGWTRVAWDDHQVTLPEPGMELDFGGIGKEYAADRAQAVLLQHGLQRGFVNLGGDIRVLGPRPDGRPWRFGIQHPRHPEATCASVELREGALATSGDYERFFITPEGRRCCHILDPRTGQPVAYWQAISVVAPVCAAAGALATIAMLLGEQALSFLQRQGVAFMAIDAQGGIASHDITISSPDSGDIAFHP